MIAPRQTPEFEKWLSRQDDRSQAKIEVRLKRLQKGNPGDHKSLGEGVFELRIHHGPGYRVYFVPQGTTVIIILAGGNKSSQDRDIQQALRWARNL